MPLNNILFKNKISSVIVCLKKIDSTHFIALEIKGLNTGLVNAEKM